MAPEQFAQAVKAMQAAAYQVLFEQFLPAYCSTREHQAEIQAGFAKIAAWAQTQPSDVYGAYLWAMKLLSENIEKRLNISDLGNQVQAAYQSIPKPEIGA